MYQTINEKIDVVAVFGRKFKEARPFKIRWQGREYTIKKIGYRHQVKEGNTVFHVFSVTDGTNFFELKYDSANLAWILGRVSDNETN